MTRELTASTRLMHVRRVSALAVTVDDAGLFLPALGLHLDPTRAVPAAFVSHAHADHAMAHDAGVLFASPQTLALLEARRREKPPGARALEWDGAVDLPLPGERAARLSIAPAGHILGAAQLVIDHPGGRFVYTGDYRSGSGATHAAGAPVACDDLVIESTYGLPIFRFPPRERIFHDLVEWCRRCLSEGTTPVVLGYALGTSQEAIHHLVAAGLPVVAHGAAYRLCEVYEALGVPLGLRDGKVRPYAEEKKKGRSEAVLVIPPSAAPSMLKNRGDARVGLVSGWSLLDAPLEQRRADRPFPVSNHADFDDLVATVRAAAPKRVYATHGDDVETFARILEGLGFDAHALQAGPLDAAEERA